jgi:class 3 adenylate cyclase
MARPHIARHLAAILAADVAGYSRLMGENDEGTLATLKIYRSAIAEIAAEHGGRIFGSFGDSAMIEFPSPVQAVRAAVAIQRAVERRNTMARSHSPTIISASMTTRSASRSSGCAAGACSSFSAQW